VSLLVEDVLLSGFVEKSVFLRGDDFPAQDVGGGGGGGGSRRRTSMSRRMSIASPTRTPDRKASDAGRRTSDVGGLTLLPVVEYGEHGL